MANLQNVRPFAVRKGILADVSMSGNVVYVSRPQPESSVKFKYSCLQLMADQSHSTSSKLVPVDSPYATSHYWL